MEVVVVDDGSDDGAQVRLCELGCAMDDASVRGRRGSAIPPAGFDAMEELKQEPARRHELFRSPGFRFAFAAVRAGQHHGQPKA